MKKVGVRCRVGPSGGVRRNPRASVFQELPLESPEAPPTDHSGACGEWHARRKENPGVAAGALKRDGFCFQRAGHCSTNWGGSVGGAEAYAPRRVRRERLSIWETALALGGRVSTMMRGKNEKSRKPGCTGLRPSEWVGGLMSVVPLAARAVNPRAVARRYWRYQT